MSSGLHTVGEDATLQCAARVMDEHNIRQVLVVDDGGRLVGLVSYRALLRVLTARPTEEIEADLPIGPLIERDVPTFTPDTPIRAAVRRMVDERLSVVPVVEADRLVGVISEHDLVDLTGALLSRALRQDPC
jgi:CBS domain-containing protein